MTLISRRARDLLGKAGYRAGRALPTLTLDLRSGDNASEQLGELFKAGARRSRIQLIDQAPWFLRTIWNESAAPLSARLRNWGLDYPDAQNVFQLLYGRTGPGSPISRASMTGG